MRRWVVTGPIGSGKSLLTGLLAERGAVVVDADAVGHEILRRPEVIREIRNEFGPGVIREGKVDRAALGAVVFNDDVALARLNGITHGPLGRLAAEKLDAAAATGERGLAVLEAAVYFLLPSPPAADLVIAVTAAREIRAARLAERGLTAAEALARIHRQVDLEETVPQADIVLVNEGSPAELAEAADRLLAEHGIG